jgi:hypothetical protein
MRDDEPSGQAGSGDTSRVQALLQEWEYRSRANIDTHARAERLFDRLNSTCAVISVGSLVALGTIASAFDLTTGFLRLLVIVLSVLGGVVSVLATVRNYGVQAAAHRNASRQYAALRREIEIFAVSGERDRVATTSQLAEFRRRWDWIADVAPNAPRRLRDKARKAPRRDTKIWEHI